MSTFNTGGPSTDPRDVGTRSDGETWDVNDPARPSANANTSTVSGDVIRAGGSGDDPIRLHPDDAPGLQRVLAWLRQRHGAYAHVHFDPAAEPLDPAQPLDVASPEPTSDQERERPGAPFEGRDVYRHAPPDEPDEDI